MKKKYIFLDNSDYRTPNWLKQVGRGKTMRYIRTKDGIYRNASVPTDLVIICRDRECELNPNDILKQADTIEELCDEFVCKHFISYDVKDLRDLVDNGIIYGAIWTDKGLIYVAKMNEKGELELL